MATTSSPSASSAEQASVVDKMENVATTSSLPSSSNQQRSEASTVAADTASVPAIVVHGGAGFSLEEEPRRSNVLAGIRQAVLAGWKILRDGGKSLSAVEEAVCVLEDHPEFNAGRGSKLTIEEEVEMDASIMAGDLRCGAVGCVRTVANPIRLARLVMEKTDHVFLVGEGAERFAREQGIPSIDNASLVVERSVKLLRREMTYRMGIHRQYKERGCPLEHEEDLHGTVGAVAVDKDGHVAFATSTGGLTAKRPGRVGDTPCIGSGGYADDKTGAVSTTGHGEAILKVCLAKRVSELLGQGVGVEAASVKALEEMMERTGSLAGLIAVDRDGRLAQSFTTEGMAWAWAKAGQMHYGLNPGEDFCQPADQE